jgi:hypothetical protein
MLHYLALGKLLLIPHVVRFVQYLRILLYVFVLCLMTTVTFLLKFWNSVWEATTTTTVLSLYNNDLFKLHRRVFLIICLASTQRDSKLLATKPLPIIKMLTMKMQMRVNWEIDKQVHCTCMKYPIIAHSVAIHGQKYLSSFITLASIYVVVCFAMK